MPQLYWIQWILIFESQAPEDNCHVNVLYFLRPSTGGCHYVTMMSGVKCHPHIRGMGGENNSPHHHYTRHENQSDQNVASTPWIETQHLQRHDPSCVTERL